MHRTLWTAVALALLCGCGQPASAPSDAMPLDAAPHADAALDDASLDAGIDAGPLECAAEPGDGVEFVAAQFPPTSTVDVPLDMLCDTIAGAVCDALAACSCDATVVARCRASSLACLSQAGSATTLARVASGEVQYDAAAAGRVVAMLRAGLTACVGPYNLDNILVAAGAFRGAALDGANCDGYAFACAAGLECQPGFDLSSSCRSSALTGCEALGLCVLNSGDFSALVCAGSRCDRGVPPGATPDAGHYCRFAPRTDGTCGCEPPAGAACSGSSQCGLGYCRSGFCAERATPLGESCAQYDQCDGGVCLDGVCLPRICGWGF